ncbi:HlyD family secretion protein [Maribacter sp. 4G9]|uniref:HlyD family secretion protein n=1 Tax=Maribacter sp. 4G9 TaxID=1889777 RepID=UPI000C14584D|nr:HlyD family efflux transporter periplasmic adaptor subunit [Maribacter sp. 4G9]PIB38977.1 secretion protein HlyD [Maribacter sp. 4G9]
MPENTQSNSLNIRSEEVQEILTNPPAWIVRWGITLIFIFAVLLIALSFIIRYPDFVTAKVLITTEQPTERIIARYNGQLEKIFVKDRDTVEINQPMAVIKNTADYEDVFYLKRILDTLRFDLAKFSFPIQHSRYLILGDIENAYGNFEKSYVDYTLMKDLEPYNNQLRGDAESLSEIKIRLVDRITQKKLLEQEFELKLTDFKRYKELFDKGVISQQEYESKELEFIQMQKNISDMAISISQMREAISSANRQLKTTYINKEEDRTRLSRNLAQSYNLLKKAILDWENNYLLVSSIRGIVSFQQYWGVNQFVKNGDVLFSTLPIENINLVGQLIIPSQNAGKVNIGQKVLVKLDNFPYQQYGMLLGKVKNISISPDTHGNYAIYISLPKGTLTSYDIDIGFDQEMLGNAEIITEDLSVAERIFFSFKELFKYG